MRVGGGGEGAEKHTRTHTNRQKYMAHLVIPRISRIRPDAPTIYRRRLRAHTNNSTKETIDHRLVSVDPPVPRPSYLFFLLSSLRALEYKFTKNFTRSRQRRR